MCKPCVFLNILIIEKVVIITIDGSNKIVNFMTTVSGGIVQGVYQTTWVYSNAIKNSNNVSDWLYVSIYRALIAIAVTNQYTNWLVDLIVNCMKIYLILPFFLKNCIYLVIGRKNKSSRHSPVNEKLQCCKKAICDAQIEILCFIEEGHKVHYNKTREPKNTEIS